MKKLHILASCKTRAIFLPEQIIPSPEYPVLHTHSKDPTELLQLAWTSQLCAFVLHSSISMSERQC